MSTDQANAIQQRTDALRRIGVFADLPEEQLQWFAEHVDEKRLAPGEVLFRRGEPSESMFVFLEGEVHARPDDNSLDGFVYIATAGDPQTEVSGRLPFSRMTEWGGTGRAVTATHVLSFPATLLPELLQRAPVLVERLVAVMSDRVREFARLNQERDKMMALGKLSAGLAHELNNPAAAARRAANELLESLEELRGSDLRLCRHSLSHDQRTFIEELESEAISSSGASSRLTALQRSDREEEFSDWLDRHGVDEGWRIAGTLVEAGFSVSTLDRVLDRVGPDALGDVLARLAAQLQTARLTSDISNSMARISELVGAIKEYSYMDQAPVQEIDLHRALDNTLLILKHKLKKKNIVIVRHYAPDVPAITACGSELNQVWTNLIDNAIDAMPDGGQLDLTTRVEPAGLLVEIRDNGRGIPDNVKSRIFEPFFTTKPVGEGTGLGLDTVGRVVRKHRGHIRFESRPGATCFQVRLPLSEQSNGDQLPKEQQE